MIRDNDGIDGKYFVDRVDALEIEQVTFNESLGYGGVDNGLFTTTADFFQHSRTTIANTIWHEAMHQWGYLHAGGSDFPSLQKNYSLHRRRLHGGDDAVLPGMPKCLSRTTVASIQRPLSELVMHLRRRSAIRCGRGLGRRRVMSEAIGPFDQNRVGFVDGR